MRLMEVLFPLPGNDGWKFFDWMEIPDMGVTVRPIEYSELKEFVEGEGSRIITPERAPSMTPHLT
jgi:hypothetical protein